ncbi:TBCC domain-containing protein 1 isoform X2 [Melanerpes formicivorus]|uniref:TBCC domain-containing protein 1 isoform X2 n=1 Tax=Melanerpes formicivorus TaxID=211600 RepID=UPI00358E4642
MEAAAAPVRLWVRTEPFLVGVLPVPPPARLAPHYLRKMAAYTRARAAEGCFPRLSWPRWRHIACGKLRLGRDLAWLYFELFHGLLRREPAGRLEWAEAEAACASAEELERERSKLSVDTLQFLLFLYIQQVNKVSLRRSLVGEEWPSPRSRSPSLAGKASSHNKNWDDQEHLAFLQSHLSELLELLLEPAGPRPAAPRAVPLAAARALGLLLEGALRACGCGAARGCGCGCGAVRPLHQLALCPPCRRPSGYCEASRAFSLPQLESWLRSCLTANPFGMSACLRAGKKLAWAQQVEGATRRAKIACSTRGGPEESSMVIMSQVYRQTLAKSSDTLVGAHVRIHRCNESFVYLLSPLRSVTIEKCRSSTFVLGPVQASLHVHSCASVTVIAVCHRLCLAACTGCTFHTLTPTQPLLLPGNHALTLAPYHTHYPALEDHMAQVGLATLPNRWAEPLLLCSERADAVFRLLPPSDLYSFVIPFEMEGDTTETPGGLPPAYQRALRRREQKVQAWQKAVKEAALSRVQEQAAVPWETTLLKPLQLSCLSTALGVDLLPSLGVGWLLA